MFNTERFSYKFSEDELRESQNNKVIECITKGFRITDDRTGTAFVKDLERGKFIVPETLEFSILKTSFCSENEISENNFRSHDENFIDFVHKQLLRQYNETTVNHLYNFYSQSTSDFLSHFANDYFRNLDDKDMSRSLAFDSKLEIIEEQNSFNEPVTRLKVHATSTSLKQYINDELKTLNFSGSYTYDCISTEDQFVLDCHSFKASNEVLYLIAQGNTNYNIDELVLMANEDNINLIKDSRFSVANARGIVLSSGGSLTCTPNALIFIRNDDNIHTLTCYRKDEENNLIQSIYTYNLDPTETNYQYFAEMFLNEFQNTHDILNISGCLAHVFKTGRNSYSYNIYEPDDAAINDIDTLTTELKRQLGLGRITPSENPVRSIHALPLLWSQEAILYFNQDGQMARKPRILKTVQLEDYFSEKPSYQIYDYKAVKKTFFEAPNDPIVKDEVVQGMLLKASKRMPGTIDVGDTEEGIDNKKLEGNLARFKGDLVERSGIQLMTGENGKLTILESNDPDNIPKAACIVPGLTIKGQAFDFSDLEGIDTNSSFSDVADAIHTQYGIQLKNAQAIIRYFHQNGILPFSHEVLNNDLYSFTGFPVDSNKLYSTFSCVSFNEKSNGDLEYINYTIDHKTLTTHMEAEKLKNKITVGSSSALLDFKQKDIKTLKALTATYSGNDRTLHALFILKIQSLSIKDESYKHIQFTGAEVKRLKEFLKENSENDLSAKLLDGSRISPDDSRFFYSDSYTLKIDDDGRLLNIADFEHTRTERISQLYGPSIGKTHRREDHQGAKLVAGGFFGGGFAGASLGAAIGFAAGGGVFSLPLLVVGAVIGFIGGSIVGLLSVGGGLLAAKKEKADELKKLGDNLTPEEKRKTTTNTLTYEVVSKKTTQETTNFAFTETNNAEEIIGQKIIINYGESSTLDNSDDEILDTTDKVQVKKDPTQHKFTESSSADEIECLPLKIKNKHVNLFFDDEDNLVYTITDLNNPQDKIKISRPISENTVLNKYKEDISKYLNTLNTKTKEIFDWTQLKQDLKFAMEDKDNNYNRETTKNIEETDITNCQRVEIY